MESGSCNRCQDPSSIFRGAPVSVASSRPSRIQVANFPARVRVTGAPLKSFTAHSTPLTPRTRVRSVSFSALVCSKYSVFASITHTSASVTSRIWLPVRLRMLAKIDVWFSSRKVQKAMAKINPRYLARSPVNILRATKFTVEPPSLPSIDDSHHINVTKKGLCVLPLRSRLKGRRIERPGLFEKVIADVTIRHGLCNHHGPRHPRHEQACPIKARFLIVTGKKCRNSL